MARCEEVIACARLLTDAHRCQVLTETTNNITANTASSLTVSRTELYAIRSLLQSAARKMEILFATETPCVELLVNNLLIYTCHLYMPSIHHLIYHLNLFNLQFTYLFLDLSFCGASISIACALICRLGIVI